MKIIIDHMNKVYRGNVHALNDISLTIPDGMFGLLGPNGAGKTTTMRIMAGILRPTNGTLQIGPFDATTERGRNEVKKILGYLPQDLGMYPDLSAYEFLDYIGILKGLNQRTQRHKRVTELLEMVALADVARRKIKTFSGGMKRRVGIAQALLNDPQLLIVDEPTAGLDPEERIRFRNLLSDLAGGNRTVLLSTHIVEDIAQTCQNLAVIKSGQTIFQGSIAEMLKETINRVWLITTQGVKPQGDFTVVSTLNLGGTMQYRVVGDVSDLRRDSKLRIEAVQPNLEDGYVWLMHAPNGASAKSVF
ncbi:ABC transporter ATP-binding protein [Tengunoibacter tsumagoiensis]|uniref:Multidrug ABC transporter ATP-binding protein n=1 Tax=Tengunoibacter tsumagoiensis TaxID=2014871 RepID=A0A401ZY90_9CHLR|nr:ABC transporter ATP-binding protein [Tengunoibacter tsumagoiensis]GCE11807.1 multidrug ABC transporter ATP-binding protein [Tengunoibacter tsumagoiensis]